MHSVDTCVGRDDVSTATSGGSLGSDEVQVRLVGEAVARAGGDCYMTARIGRMVVSVGDVVEARAQGGSPPYIGLITSMTRKGSGRPRLWLRWFYRPCDMGLPAGSVPENEVFLGPRSDRNDFDVVFGKCELRFVSPSRVSEVPRSVFFCSRCYAPSTRGCSWLSTYLLKRLRVMQAHARQLDEAWSAPGGVDGQQSADDEVGAGGKMDDSVDDEESSEDLRLHPSMSSVGGGIESCVTEGQEKGKADSTPPPPMRLTLRVFGKVVKSGVVYSDTAVILATECGTRPGDVEAESGVRVSSASTGMDVDSELTESGDEETSRGVDGRSRSRSGSGSGSSFYSQKTSLSPGVHGCHTMQNFVGHTSRVGDMFQVSSECLPAPTPTPMLRTTEACTPMWMPGRVSDVAVSSYLRSARGVFNVSRLACGMPVAAPNPTPAKGGKIESGRVASGVFVRDGDGTARVSIVFVDAQPGTSVDVEVCDLLSVPCDYYGPCLLSDETALTLLCECGYDVDAALGRLRGGEAPSYEAPLVLGVPAPAPVPAFEKAFNECGKHFWKMARAMGVSDVGSVVSFYYTHKHRHFSGQCVDDSERQCMHCGGRTADCVRCTRRECGRWMCVCCWRSRAWPQRHSRLYIPWRSTTRNPFWLCFECCRGEQRQRKSPKRGWSGSGSGGDEGSGSGERQGRKRLKCEVPMYVALRIV